MATHPSRRRFLRIAPAAAAAFATTPTIAAAAKQQADATQRAAPENFQIFTAGKLLAGLHRLQATPGNDNLFPSATLPFSIMMTTENKKAAKEFEWHEGRDHILQILEGSTVYEVGGTPQDGRNIRPMEWLAPGSEGATTLTLHKGDMLVIPRGTPHKRTTAESVAFYLISITGK